jgi:hypothetical protein
MLTMKIHLRRNKEESEPSLDLPLTITLEGTHRLITQRDLRLTIVSLQLPLESSVSPLKPGWSKEGSLIHNSQ